MYKKLYTNRLCLLFSITVFLYLLNGSIVCTADTITSHNTEENTKIESPTEHQNQLEKEIEMLRKDLYQSNIEAYNRNAQATDRLINVILLIATIFGIIIALAGVLVGFESIRSRRRREEAIKTLEGAQEYVEEKTTEFDKKMEERLKKTDERYNKLIQLSVEQLSQDAEEATKRVKEMAEKGISTEAEKKVEMLDKRIKFFEEVGMPDDPKVLFSKAMMLKGKKMLKESLELLEKATERNPDYKSAYWQIGWIQLEMENYEKSIEAYNVVIKSDSTDASAYNNRGVALNRLGKKELALEAYNKAIEIDPKPLYYKNKAGILKSLRRYEESLESYEKSIEFKPENLSLYRYKAEILLKLNRTEDALNTLDKTVEIEPDKAGNYSAAGRVLTNEGKIKEAIKYYKEAKKIYDKILHGSHVKEGDWLNCFESLLILGNYKEASVFKSTIGDKIKSLKYLYVFEFLEACLSFLKNNKTDGFKRSFEIVKSFPKSPLEKATIWNFGDINPFLKLKLDEKVYQTCFVIEELLLQKTSVKECKARIQELKK